MGKDPAVLFYTSDFLTGTSRLTDEQCGQYIRALCSQHQEGHFTKEELFQLLKSYDNQVWKKFSQDENGKYYNERMDIEINKRSDFCMSRSHKGLAGRKSLKIENHTEIIRLANGNHAENENDNEDRIDIEVKKFQEEVNKYQTYPEEMRQKFISYWTEPNKSKTKLHFQLEKTWDTSRRLNTWASRDKDFNKSQSSGANYERLN